MTYKSTRYILFAVISLVIFSCKDNPTGSNSGGEEPDLPDASFNVSGDMYTGGTVSFNNTSDDADSYTWNFGDGTTSNESNPTNIYGEYGDYEVELIAENEDGSDTSSTTIFVQPSEMHIQSISLNDMPFTDSEGNQWDSFSNPDPFIVVANGEDSTVSRMTQTSSDVAPSELPITWNFNEDAIIYRDQFETPLAFGVYDEDNAEHDLVGYSSENFLTIKDRWADNPENSLTLEYEGVEIEFSVSWE